MTMALEGRGGRAAEQRSSERRRDGAAGGPQKRVTKRDGRGGARWGEMTRVELTLNLITSLVVCRTP